MKECPNKTKCTGFRLGKCTTRDTPYFCLELKGEYKTLGNCAVHGTTLFRKGKECDKCLCALEKNTGKERQTSEAVVPLNDLLVAQKKATDALKELAQEFKNVRNADTYYMIERMCDTVDGFVLVHEQAAKGN